MNYLNETIIKTALLGTKNRKLDPTIFTPLVEENISKNQSDEALFLEGIALSFTYFRSGEALLKYDKKEMLPPCKEEHKPYVALRFELFLEKILKEPRESALGYMVLVLGKLDGAIFSSAYLVQSYKKFNTTYLIKEVIEAFGERGAWLYQLDNEGKSPPSPRKKERAKVYEKLLPNYKEIDLSYLNGYNEEEIVSFIEKAFQKKEREILACLLKEKFTQIWSNTFTEKLLEFIFNEDTLYPVDRVRYLSLYAPYLHQDFLKIIHSSFMKKNLISKKEQELFEKIEKLNEEFNHL